MSSKTQIHAGSDTDLGAGRVSDEGAKQLVTEQLEFSKWQLRWAKRLTRYIFRVSITAYVLLALFAIKELLCSPAGSYTAIPIVLALSAVPTILILIQSKYFHHRKEVDDAKNDLDLTQASLVALLAKELPKVVSRSDNLGS